VISAVIDEYEEVEVSESAGDDEVVGELNRGPLSFSWGKGGG